MWCKSNQGEGTASRTSVPCASMTLSTKLRPTVATFSAVSDDLCYSMWTFKVDTCLFKLQVGVGWLTGPTAITWEQSVALFVDSRWINARCGGTTQCTDAFLSHPGYDPVSVFQWKWIKPSCRVGSPDGSEYIYSRDEQLQPSLQWRTRTGEWPRTQKPLIQPTKKIPFHNIYYFFFPLESFGTTCASCRFCSVTYWTKSFQRVAFCICIACGSAFLSWSE